MLHDPKVLKAVIPFISTDCTRPALNGARIRGAQVAATDGHRAIILEEKNPIPDAEFPTGHGLEPIGPEVIVPADVLKGVTARAFKPNRMLPILDKVLLGQNGKPTFYRTNMDQAQAIPFAGIEGPWPHLEGVIPTEEPTVSFHVNAEYLADACKALGSVADGLSHRIVLELHGPNKALVLRVETPDHKGMALVMPLQMPK